MPNNTDNSGSARAARFKRISAAQGPTPAIRPNIGSMALDAVIGKGLCCPSDSAPPPPPVYPTLVFISCGISTQTLSPNTQYVFINNTTNFVRYTYSTPSGSNSGILNPDSTDGPVENLVSWSSTSCPIGTITVGVFPYVPPPVGCVEQVLSPSLNYQFVPYPEGPPPPYSIIIRDSSGNDTTVSIPDFTPIGPFSQLVSWRTCL